MSHKAAEPNGLPPCFSEDAAEDQGCELKDSGIRSGRKDKHIRIESNRRMHHYERRIIGLREKTREVSLVANTCKLLVSIIFCGVRNTRKRLTLENKAPSRLQQSHLLWAHIFIVLDLKMAFSLVDREIVVLTLALKGVSENFNPFSNCFMKAIKAEFVVMEIIHSMFLKVSHSHSCISTLHSKW